MDFLKIATSNGEIRWLNLARVTRASLTADASSGEKVLTVVFPNDKITIRGGSPEDQRAIATLLEALDAQSRSAAAA